MHKQSNFHLPAYKVPWPDGGKIAWGHDDTVCHLVHSNLPDLVFRGKMYVLSHYTVFGVV